jgi:hypothetical protein
MLSSADLNRLDSVQEVFMGLRERINIANLTTRPARPFAIAKLAPDRQNVAIVSISLADPKQFFTG